MISSGDNSKKSMKVLYVDDDPAFLEIVKLILERDQSFIVDTTLSCFDALILLRGGEYDAVLSDYRMIRMDGSEFLQKTREIDPDIPFIFFSGKSKIEVAYREPEDHNTIFFHKGGDPAIRYAELERCISERVHLRRDCLPDHSSKSDEK